MIGAAHIGIIAAATPREVPAPGAGATLPVTSGLMLHLDASSAGTITLTSGAVSQWDDRSGNGRDFTQATAGNRPVVESGPNGYATVDFGVATNGSGGDWLGHGSDIAGKTFIAVTEMTAGGGFVFGHGVDYPFHPGNPFTPAAGMLHPTYSSSALRTTTATTRRNGLSVTPTTAYKESAWHVVVFRTNGTAVNVARLLCDRLVVTGGAKLAEVAIYDSVLSDSDVITLEGHLAQKWGFAHRLQAGHAGYVGEPVETLPITPTPLIWVDPSDVARVYTAGGYLRQLVDKSGNGRHLVRGPITVDVEATLLTAEQNGSDAADFGPFGTGGKQMSFEIASGKTFVMVIGGSATRTGGHLFTHPWNYPFHRGGGSALSDALLSSAYSNASLRTGSATTRKDGTAITPTLDGLDTGWQILVFRSDGTANEVGSVFYDRNNPAASGGGVIGDIMLFGSVLSDEDVEKIEGYLAHKWGLTGSLPGGHPYKISPP